ncbi:unnamed protein product [Gongylonema pulchrum]|uniref:Uncharacterized protein n=1 Tax=Gongylonema pulchrum TaxID=637853 RepID=A0A3P7P1T6_9BILA|nr:unnamed protein product [Gongylonema pulchrum]
MRDTRQRVDDLTPAKRAGDYYMFEYDPSQDALDEPVETFVPEVSPGAGDFDKLDPAQLVHTAVQRDLDLAGTLDAVESAEQISDKEKRMAKAVSDEKSGAEKKQTPAYSSIDDEPRPGNQITAALCFVKKLLISAADWSAAFMNRRSREHRYVAYVLGKEKEKLKERLKQPLVDSSRPVMDVRQEFVQQNLQCVSSTSDIER